MELHAANNNITFIRSRQQPTLAMPPQLSNPNPNLLTQSLLPLECCRTHLRTHWRLLVGFCIIISGYWNIILGMMDLDYCNMDVNHLNKNTNRENMTSFWSYSNRQQQKLHPGSPTCIVVDKLVPVFATYIPSGSITLDTLTNSLKHIPYHLDLDWLVATPPLQIDCRGSSSYKLNICPYWDQTTFKKTTGWVKCCLNPVGPGLQQKNIIFGVGSWCHQLSDCSKNTEICDW